MNQNELELISKHSEFVDSIIYFLRGTTGINFQRNTSIIFKEYYLLKEKKYVMPEPMRGDYKNDGYVLEDGIFYMIYSPLSHIDNITKDMKKKFEGDISGLTEYVYSYNYWGGKINEAIFLVNNIDKDLPPDPSNFFQNKAQEYKNKYNVEFLLRVESLDYIRNILNQLPISNLIRIKTQLNISNTVDLNVPNAQEIIDTIGYISEQMGNKLIYSEKIDSYTRISTPLKIKINKLEERAQEINAILDKASIVKEVIEIMNQDIKLESKFDTTRKYIIEVYEELSKKYSGVELYDMIIFHIIEAHKCKKAFELPLKFLVIYIFDKCDIFEKEEEKYDDITK